jgi:hypothetical protein
MIVEQSVECSERRKGRSTAMLLKVVDEIEEIQRVEGPPSHRALAEEDDATKQLHIRERAALWPTKA